MYSVTRLLDVAAPDLTEVLDTVRVAAERSGARHRLVQPTLPGARNGGDVLVHLRFDSHNEWHSAANDFDAVFTDPRIMHVNGACYAGAPLHNSDHPASVYRALLLRVQPETEAATLAWFERDLLTMPRYVPTMTAWQLSRVAEPLGTTAWTHVFEQEFTDIDALLGPYLMHPIHWAVVDRWFDPECPEVIISDRVCHSFCELPCSVLV